MSPCLCTQVTVPNQPSHDGSADAILGLSFLWNSRGTATALQAPQDAPETATCSGICKHRLSSCPKCGRFLNLSGVQHRPSQKDLAEAALAAGPDVDVCRCKGSCQMVCACHPQALGCCWSVQVDKPFAKSGRLTGIVHRVLHCQSQSLVGLVCPADVIQDTIPWADVRRSDMLPLTKVQYTCNAA